MRYGMYNKLFTKILDSSIWLESKPTRIVWVTFIAVMDESGFAQFATVENVARRANVSVGEAQKAIESLESPDTNSSDPDNEGRRIERVPGGWIVLNATKYRELVTRAIIREQTVQRVQRYRQKRNAPVTLDTVNSETPVTPSEAVAETKAEAEREKKRPAAPKQPKTTTRGKAFVGDCLSVPMFLHEDFGRELGSDFETFDLLSWYQRLDDELKASGEKFETLSYLRSHFLRDAKIPVPARPNPNKPRRSVRYDDGWRDE